jgi:hypothetical protein
MGHSFTAKNRNAVLVWTKGSKFEADVMERILDRLSAAAGHIRSGRLIDGLGHTFIDGAGGLSRYPLSESP